MELPLVAHKKLKLLALTGLGLLASAPLFSAQSPLPAGWKVYVDLGGYYKLYYPAGWQILSRGNALVISSPGDPANRGVFGITPRAEGSTIQQSVDKEFQDPQRSPDIQKAAARLANRPAIKVWGSKKGDPNIRVVEYYVQKGAQQYYILFQAPHASMSRFSPIFNKMIGSMKFLK